MLVIRLRGRAVAVAPEIRYHHGEMLSQHRGHFMPRDMGLRIAMDEQHRGARSADFEMNGGFTSGNVSALEPFKHGALLRKKDEG